ncbi:MAG: phosphotransferase, partial [Acidimicrobiales bacterium]
MISQQNAVFAGEFQGFGFEGCEQSRHGGLRGGVYRNSTAPAYLEPGQYDFRAALDADRVQRAADARNECEAALAYEDVLAHWHGLLAQGLTWRTTHNDCKLNNLLFAADDRGICVVDLDPVMPSTLLF